MKSQRKLLILITISLLLKFVLRHKNPSPAFPLTVVFNKTLLNRTHGRRPGRDTPLQLVRGPSGPAVGRGGRRLTVARGLWAVEAERVLRRPRESQWPKGKGSELRFHEGKCRGVGSEEADGDGSWAPALTVSSQRGQRSREPPWGIRGEPGLSWQKERHVSKEETRI